MSRPFVLALTGSIGMGKTTVGRMFEELGVPVFDADAIVHRLQGPGGALVPEIEAAFPGTTGAAGVDRRKLGTAVFDDASALKRLEAIVHPAVRVARREFLIRHAGEKLVVLDIPLLFETGGAEEADAVLVVSAPAAVQRARVMARPGMTPGRFAQILARQTPDVEKRLGADFVIETGRSLKATRDEVALLVDKLTA